LVPVYLLLGRFSNTTAVALSNASIFAASVANVLLVVPRRRCGRRANLQRNAQARALSLLSVD
jgi:hypothetical protein